MTDPDQTLPRLLQRIRGEHAERIALTRWHGRGGEPSTYAELIDSAHDLAAGLYELGIRRGDRVGLLADNRREWLLCDMALALLGAISVPRGADTAPSEMVFILRHAECRMVFAQDPERAAELRALDGELDELELFGNLEGPAGDPLSVAGLVERGRARRAGGDDPVPELAAAVRPDDTFTLVYTSGTTADPKGVDLTHANLRANIRCVREVLHIDHEDHFLSVLPSWHMYERTLEWVALSAGARLTYTDRRNIKQDLVAERPTVFAAVPRIWEMIHDGIVGHAHRSRGVQRRLLLSMLRVCREVGSGRARRRTRLLHALYRRTLLRRVLGATGGRLRLAVSGGGALPTHVDETLLGIGLPLLNGYGLTETSPVAAVRLPETNRPLTIGPPLPDTEIEVRAPDGRRLPPGEVGILWIRGPQVMRGYYRNPERTAAVLDADGWFNTGDLACIDTDGHVRITGRAKDTIVLAGGENVEPEPLEMAIKTSPLIEQAVVLGQDQKGLGALIVPMADCLEKQVARAEWHERDGVLRGEAVAAAIRSELDRVLTREAGFRAIDRITTFRVLAEPLTIENGILTPTLKVKRHVVAERFAPLIAEMFGRPVHGRAS